MSHWPTTPLKEHIAEVSIRKGETPAEVLSVTNTGGFVPSLDVFEKQVFSRNASNYKLVRFNDLGLHPFLPAHRFGQWHFPLPVT